MRQSLLAAVVVVLSLVASGQPASVEVKGAPVAIQILAQSPADTTTELQAICLFRSSPENTLHGSLTEIDEKVKGLLGKVRKQDLFRGELGETLIITPPKGSLNAKRLLLIGLGDSETFAPARMQLVGEILYAEASRAGVAHPFFAPTILDGGVNKFTTGEVAGQVLNGFLRAAALGALLRDAPIVKQLTFLAGEKNVNSTREGIEKAIAAPARR